MNELVITTTPVELDKDGKPVSAQIAVTKAPEAFAQSEADKAGVDQRQ